MNIINPKEKRNPNIQDLDIYLSRMEKGMDDKLFFLPYLKNIQEPILFVDFGCANGSLIKHVLETVPNVFTVGIDESKHMSALIQKNLNDKLDRFHFYTSLEEFELNLSNYQDKYTLVLNLSSVLHEIHHYSTNDEVNKFYQKIIKLNFDYIFIRDMYCPDTKRFHTKFGDYEKFSFFIKSHEYMQTQLKQFESVYGDIVFQKNLLHFLMKYKYIENWDRECNENYFPQLHLDKFNQNYEVLLKKEYQLPYLTKLWKDELNIELEENTHIQCVYKKKT